MYVHIRILYHPSIPVYCVHTYLMAYLYYTIQVHMYILHVLRTCIIDSSPSLMILVVCRLSLGKLFCTITHTQHAHMLTIVCSIHLCSWKIPLQWKICILSMKYVTIYITGVCVWVWVLFFNMYFVFYSLWCLGWGREKLPAVYFKGRCLTRK